MGFLHPPGIRPGHAGHEVTDKQEVVALLATLI